MFQKDLREFVELLIKHKAEYLIVGGYAVGVHGYPRYTGDLDIWLNPSIENAQKIVLTVNEFGFSSLKLTEADFTKENNIVQLGYPPLRIDLMTAIDGVIFAECFKNKKVVNMAGLKVNFISYSDLLKNKQASNRPQDKADLDKLQETVN
jgi:hypothetical protein